ncbi:ribonuclease H2 subunit B isoform X1 [Python bivittatus]|uniref:Ribonuclease H2 subunit B n=1 Tax=Python bivittatus TaxID=176946 RepID=A0A9F2Q2W3_PYTBI|nr:ribonuclease H2 subunit B isoform X1 [Python bivittatus]
MPSGKGRPPAAPAKSRGGSSARQWVVVLPETATDLPKKPDAGPLFTRLPHPSTGQAALYLFGSDAYQIFEIKAFHEEYRSWFIGQEVQRDGRLFFATPMDPLFLVLFYLIKAEKEQGKFQPLNQILVDEEFSSSMKLLQCTSTSQSIHHLAEQKEIGGKKFFRYSEEKTLKWLKKKVNQLVKVLKENNIPVGGKVQAATFISNNPVNSGTEEDYIRYAHGLITEYVPEELSTALAKYLCLPQSTDLPAEPASKKRKLSDAPVEAAEDYTKFNTVDLKNKKASNKMSAAQKALAKVDKSGMKAMSSFFRPKTTAPK